MFKRLVVCFITCIAISATTGYAQISHIINYQGKVTDSGGSPIPDGTYVVRFHIYDAESSGTELWDSGDRTAQVSGGVFDFLLGQSPQPALNLSFNQDYWLLLEFEGWDQLPLQRLSAVPYALMSDGLMAGTEVIGLVNTGTFAAIRGTNTATTGTTYGGYFVTDSDGGVGVYGDAPRYGVFGKSTATTGTHSGGYFESYSPSGRGVSGIVYSSVGASYGVHGQSASTSGAGVYGDAMNSTGITTGVLGRSSSTSGRGVSGYADALTGTTHGVIGTTESESGRGVSGYSYATTGTGYGVYGRSSSTDGIGVYGEGTATTGYPHGLYGVCNSTSGYAVRGRATSSTGIAFGVHGSTSSSSDWAVAIKGAADASMGLTCGVYGFTNSASDDARAVFGQAAATSGATYGGYFSTNSPSGYGVYGVSPGGTGIWGEDSATTGANFGVWGTSQSTSGRGVYGRAYATTGTNYGVYGRTDSPAGFAGYFYGNVHITGMLSKGGGSFLIDHPLDPENMLLRHNFVESPENLLLYRGTIQLDAAGVGIVVLPAYFVSLADEELSTVNLTPIGRSMSHTPYEFSYQWNRDNSAFQVFGEPGREVAWLVMADRDDPVIRQLGRPVEEKKSPDNPYCDQGNYLYPEAYGFMALRHRNNEP